MKDHEGDHRAFIHLNRAWYGPANLRLGEYVDEVWFGYQSPGGGTSGECMMRWYELSAGTPTPRLEVFDDSWHALWTFKDVLEQMAELDDRDITPDQFCRLLVACGFRDDTPVDEEKQQSLERKILALVAEERKKQ